MAADLQFLHQLESPSCLGRIRELASAFPDQPALIHDAKVVAYGQLRDSVQNLRDKCRALGLQGKRILLLVPNSKELIQLQLAFLFEGCQLALTDVRTKPDALHEICSLFHPDWLICSDELESEARACDDSPAGFSIQVLSELVQDMDGQEERSLEEPVSGAELVYFRQDREDRWQGSSFTLDAIEDTVHSVRQLFALHLGDAVLCHMSGAHYLSLSSMILPALSSGGKLVLMDRNRPLEEVLDAIAVHNPKLMIHYRRHFWFLHKLALEKRARGEALGCLHHAVVNADSPALPFRDSWEDLFCGNLLSGFATTSAGSFLTLNLPWLENRDAFVGKALPGVELRIVDESGNDRPNGRWGEVHFQSSGQSTGFLENPDGNPEECVEGWHRTQQMAMRNTDGFLTLADEIVDVIWVYGFKVSPLEVEEQLLEQPGILDCAAVNAPRSTHSDQIQLFVVSEMDDEGRPLWNEERLRKVCERLLPPYLRPGMFHLIDEIPYDDEEFKLRKVLKYRRQSDEPWRSN